MESRKKGVLDQSDLKLNRVPILRPSFDWSEATRAWRSLIGENSEFISFPDFSFLINNTFIADPDLFLTDIRHSYKLEPKIPNNFNKLDPRQKCCIFFSFLKLVFSFDELDEFVKGNKLGESRFAQKFTKDQTLIFTSITIIYQGMLGSIEERLCPKYAPRLSFTLAKQFIPNDRRHLKDNRFVLTTVFISPIKFTNDLFSESPCFIYVNSNGGFTIKNATAEQNIMEYQFNQNVFLQKENIVEFYSDGYDPVFSIQFPSNNSMATACSVLLNPPSPGYNHLTTFIQSVEAFETFNKFFPSGSIIPNEFYRLVKQCIDTREMEIILYLFTLNPDESKMNHNNSTYYISLVADRVIPFFRAGVEMSWIDLLTGDLVLRANTQLSFFCTGFLKALSKSYSDKLVSEMINLIDKNADKFQNKDLTSEEAKAFVEDLFEPAAKLVLESCKYMPTQMRILLRVLYLRSAGHYIGERAPLIIFPNLVLLRFVLPQYTNETLAKYNDSVPLREASKLLGRSMLSLFYWTGWDRGTYPTLTDYSDRMTAFYRQTVRFMIEVIDVDEDVCDMSELKPSSVDVIDFISYAAKRVTLMNMKTPNKLIHSHMDCVSVMQMLEEFSYDYTQAKDLM